MLEAAPTATTGGATSRLTVGPVGFVIATVPPVLVISDIVPVPPLAVEFTVTTPVPPAGDMVTFVPATICVTPPPPPVALIVAYGLDILPVIVIPVPAMALRTSAPFSELLMNLRNHVASHSVGIDSTLAPLIPGFVFSWVVTLPLARLDHRGHVHRERW